ncbi:MAG TPA: 5-(carboxyamino)imidazole ribonucleotide synthase [Ignavibacteria bacterium]|nr:5-(carboxyamino)imidazole ribonucleotide synthase [Ignavibacteria bacterium]
MNIEKVSNLNEPLCIGILGGGQLARMSAYQAYKLGFDVAIIEKEKDSPAGRLTHNEFVGWVDNKRVLNKFIECSDIITLENEFIDYKYLAYIEKKGKTVLPSSKNISLIQDKLTQKESFAKVGIPTAKFTTVDKESSYSMLSKILGKSFILKSRKMGYDGYGNAKVTNEKTFIEGSNILKSRHNELFTEEFINFNKELAIMVVRTNKEIKTYPVVETIQKNHICHTVIAPAQIESGIKRQAEDIAIESVKAVAGFGLFGVELFLTKEGEILLNEMAPRPHNSGHYTIEACVTSQFENHIRSVLNLPLGSTSMVMPYAVMINLLGKENGNCTVDNYNQALKNDDVHLHVYGKAVSRIGRKMGHITILGNDLESTLSQARNVEMMVSL